MRGLALHELTANAVKYGTLSAKAGSVKVRWSLAANGMLVIVWTESHGL
jgi:two-component sensor histidine kinase